MFCSILERLAISSSRDLSKKSVTWSWGFGKQRQIYNSWKENKLRRNQGLVKEIYNGVFSSNVFKKALKWLRLANVGQGRLSDFEY